MLIAERSPVAQAPSGSIRAAYSGQLMPPVQVHAFRNTDKFFPTRSIARGANVRPLAMRTEQIEDFPIQSQGSEFDLYDYVSRN